MRLLQTLVFYVLSSASYAQAQKAVMPPTVQVSLGQSATLSCEVGVKENYAVSFHKQVSGEVPQLILYHHHSWSEPRYGPGMSSAHFTATVNSAGTQYQLLVKDAEITDTVHYYCSKWYPSVSGYHSDTQPDKNNCSELINKITIKKS